MNERYSAESHFMPLPELLTDAPGIYDIVDSRSVEGLPTNGMVDQVNQVMVVPFDAPGRVVSRHECAHVLWTPVRRPALPGSPAFIQAVEDGRINRGLRVIGLGIDLERPELAQVVELGAQDLERGDEGLCQWALRTVASYGTNAERPLLALVDMVSAPLLPFGGVQPLSLPHRVHAVVVRAHAKLERARVRAEGPVGSARDVNAIARWLRRELSALGLPEPATGGALVCCLGSGPARRKRGGRKWRSRGLLGGGDEGAGGPPAGRMKISEPALPHATVPSSRGLARGRRAAEEGTVLRNIWRFAHDQKVFAVRTRRRRGGGSVLIDTSGSMRLSASDIEKLIAGAPAATLVALYSGREADGELRIVVRDGRRVGVDGLEPYGPANVVDLPALEWLAKQPAPRIWISDGGVTGAHDRPSRDVKLRCMKVCRHASIERVDDADAAAKRLAPRR